MSLFRMYFDLRSTAGRLCLLLLLAESTLMLIGLSLRREIDGEFDNLGEDGSTRNEPWFLSVLRRLLRLLSLGDFGVVILLARIDFPRNDSYYGRVFLNLVLILAAALSCSFSIFFILSSSASASALSSFAVCSWALKFPTYAPSVLFIISISAVIRIWSSLTIMAASYLGEKLVVRSVLPKDVFLIHVVLMVLFRCDSITAYLYNNHNSHQK